MSDHVIDWLSAYLDGELKGGRLQRVEEHLSGCEACRDELEALRGLSALLQNVPPAEFPAHERFVSQVNLRLPPRPVRMTGRKVAEVGWWLIPIGLLAAWIFFSSVVLVSDMLTAANTVGLLDGAGSYLVSRPPENAVLTSVLGQVGLLEGDNLLWAESTESYTRNLLPQFIWQISIALLYLAWIAIGWARRMHPGHAGLLES